MPTLEAYRQTNDRQTTMIGQDHTPAGKSEEMATQRAMRVNWQLKAVWPVAVVLLVGMFLFLLATLSLRDTNVIVCC